MKNILFADNSVKATLFESEVVGSYCMQLLQENFDRIFSEAEACGSAYWRIMAPKKPVEITAINRLTFPLEDIETVYVFVIMRCFNVTDLVITSVGVSDVASMERFVVSGNEEFQEQLGNHINDYDYDQLTYHLTRKEQEKAYKKLRKRIEKSLRDFPPEKILY